MTVVQDKIKAKEEAIENSRKEVEAQSLIISEEKKIQKQKEIQDMLMEYQQMVQDEQAKASNRETELLQPIQQKLRIAIENVAKREGFDYVLDQANTYYANGAWDISNQVLRELQTIKLPKSPK